MMSIKRLLWVEKLSDNKLKKLLEKVDSLQRTGVTDDEELIKLATAHYDNSVRIEQFTALSIDLWREGADRFCIEK